jgi:hypothetical protein
VYFSLIFFKKIIGVFFCLIRKRKLRLFLSFCEINWIYCRTFFSSLEERYKLCVSFRGDICTFPRTKNKKGN